MVFVETKRQADFIAVFLCQEKVPTTSIHGYLTPPSPPVVVVVVFVAHGNCVCLAVTESRGNGSWL